MQRIKITVPATVTNVGPGLGALGLAVQLNAALEFQLRDDHDLSIKTSGAGADAHKSLTHPVVLAAMRVFQHAERAPTGFSVKVNNNIPPESGLGDDAAFALAGVIGANNLIGADLTRDEIGTLAAQVSGSAAGVAAAMLGGLATGLLAGGTLVQRALAPAPMRLVVALPDVRRYANKAERATPKVVAYDDALANLSRLPLLVDAFRREDYPALADLMHDQLLTPKLADQIPGYEEAVRAGKRAGAHAVTLSGRGPALVAFAADKHHAIADAMRGAFANADVTAQTWVLPVDRQGVAVSMTQSAR